MSDKIGREMIDTINVYVKSWTKKYIFYTKPDLSTPGRYICEFSKPTRSKPIPISTVRVYFFTEGNSNKKEDLKF